MLLSVPIVPATYDWVMGTLNLQVGTPTSLLLYGLVCPFAELETLNPQVEPFLAFWPHSLPP